MKKLHLSFLYGYSKKEVYLLADKLGRRLTDFLGKDIFMLLLDSKILLYANIKGLRCISDETYKLHPAAKALEGYLNKVIKGKKLQEAKSDTIGEVFGKKDQKVRQKIKDRRLVAKTKTVWDFCRNDIMHFSSTSSSDFSSLNKKHEEIIELIVLLFKDFYGKTERDEEIKKGLNKYFRSRSAYLKKTTKTSKKSKN